MPAITTNKQIQISYPDGRPPTPKQLLVHNDQISRVKMIEGGFGSAKTYCVVMDLLMNLLYYEDNECLYGRLTMDEINRTFFPVWRQLCPEELILSHNKADRTLTIMTYGKPSTLHYMPLDDSKGALHKLKSMNLGYAAIDQTEEISEDIFEAILGRLRRKGTRRQLCCNANPEGHNWIWRRFIKEEGRHRKHKLYEMNPWKEDAPIPAEKELEDRAIQLGKDTRDLVIEDFPEYMQYTDNPFLPMDYLLDMLSWADQLKRRYVFGKHDAFEGLIYTEFDQNIHLIPAFDTLSKKYLRVISMDYGKQNPMAIHFWDIDESGNVYCSAELYQAQLEVPIAKTMVRGMNRDKEVRAWIADPSIFKVNSPDLPSIGDLFADDTDASGWAIRWTGADNSAGAVNAGIETVKQYLSQQTLLTSQPKVYFMRGRCPNLIEEIMDYRWKEMARTITLVKAKNVPEVPRKYKDHAMDSMRYALTFIKRNNLTPDNYENRFNQLRKMLKLREFKFKNVRGHMVA